jgi:hypothetical protein
MYTFVRIKGGQCDISSEQLNIVSEMQNAPITSSLSFLHYNDDNDGDLTQSFPCMGWREAQAIEWLKALSSNPSTTKKKKTPKPQKPKNQKT